ncbi:MAG: LptF/LptG family permease [Rhodospirillales bacterium]|nr:LptF/LptG family permease [Rhodospirillales bacterium]MBO6786254.1 LptF/LptG family permease [Rhodospirillales bacterium]
MNSYTRYVLRQLFAGMVLVSAGLTCIIWLSQSLRFVEMIVNRGLSAGTFVYMTMLLLPNFLTVILPIALFTVIVFTYSKMVTDRELVVMRAAGVGQFGLAKPALIITFLTLAFGYLLNLYLLPESYRSFRILQWEIRNTYSHVLLKEGSFNPITNLVTVYIRERAPDGQLLGILVHDEREATAPVTLMAERGALVDTGKGPRVVMYNGNRQTVGENAKLSILYFDRYVFEVPTSSESLADRFREPRERSMAELINLEDAEGITEHDWGKYKVELHKRFVTPLLGVGYAMVGLACLLYGPITRRSQTMRIVTAVSIMIALQGAALGLENIIAKKLFLVPLLYALAAVPILAGTMMLMRHPRAPKPRKSKLKAA